MRTQVRCAALALAVALGWSLPALAGNDYDKGNGAFTTDGYPPVMCDSDSFVSGIKCARAWCKNVGLVCRRPVGAFWGGKLDFRPYFNHRRGRDECPEGYAVAGLSCDERRCQRMSLLCAPIIGRQPVDCETVGPVSDDTGEYVVGDGRIVTGLTCEGEFCAEISLVACRLEDGPVTRADEP